MGYTTYFEGSVKITPPLSENHKLYLQKFNETRRMKRHETHPHLQDDPLRIAVNLPTGIEGEFFVGSKEPFGQDFTRVSVKDSNSPPGSQPGLWCQWRPSNDGKVLEWDSGEKFYYYVEWLEYLIKNFFDPWGYVLNGEINWQGEDEKDTGTIVVLENIVLTND
jgi:hypothetical protein